MLNQCSGCLDIVKIQFLPSLDTTLSLQLPFTWSPFGCPKFSIVTFSKLNLFMLHNSLFLLHLCSLSSHILKLISVFNQITIQQEVKWLIAPLEEHCILKLDTFLIGRIQKPSQNKLFFQKNSKAKGLNCTCKVPYPLFFMPTLLYFFSLSF